MTDLTQTQDQTPPPDQTSPRPQTPSVQTSPTEASQPRLSANEIADALGWFQPTEQQRAVIEAPLGPALVVAGAGSGKTETMANRVVWLLANGLVTPGQILGLTFTRKAAGELAERIRLRVAQLAAKGLIDDYDEFDPPTVATYNSFANTIYRDNALLLGREPDGTVLSGASAWQLARRIVLAHTDPRLPELDKSVDIITDAVLNLAHAIVENNVDTDALIDYAERFSTLADLPAGGKGAYAEVDEMVERVGALPVLTDLARAYTDAKTERGLVEYADQVALALQIVRRATAVRAELRDRYRVVLLDEYQDTSVPQTWLLSELFGNHPVMAVGDPNQSIYGWRGASAANLEQFATQFGSPTPDDNHDVHRYALSTSWRNGHDILRLANGIVAPLVRQNRVAVERLQPGPVATDIPVDVAYDETVNDEADRVATWLKHHLANPISEGDRTRPPSAALLFRARATQQVFLQALRRHGVPHHVLGIGGLLAEPEIADLVSALSVLADPDAGSSLVRLLAGSRWRIGVRDLHALRQLASRLSDRGLDQRLLPETVRERLRASLADDESASIIDALDVLAGTRPDHDLFGLRDRFSDIGIARLRDAGHTIDRLRRGTTLDLLDLVTLVEQELMLDIEVAANETRSEGREAMEAFHDALANYQQVDDNATLAGFLAWLRDAEWRDGLAPRTEAAEPGTVQVLTIHGSKGLEWDIVAVPRLVADELPAKPNEGTGGWLRLGELPYPFRGDADELPAFDWEQAATRKDAKALRDEFKKQVGAHQQAEERRLAYVAITRARHSLLLTGSFWSTQTKCRRPSVFLTELADRGLIPELPTEPRHEENPLGDDADQTVWPLDPLGTRRPHVEAAAERIRHATPDGGRWRDDIDLLLEERRRRVAEASRAEPPPRVPASRFKDHVTNPDAVARALRRPMPERPYRATLLGTLFHEWVEHRYGNGNTPELIDAFAHEVDHDQHEEHLDREALRRLQETFERSPWSARTPVEVEREIHLPLADRIIVCKIDAVYETDRAADGTQRYEVVDWKTGKAPRDATELDERQLQLALYRQAYAEWRGIDPNHVDAALYYVADDRIIRPTRMLDRAELETLWRNSRQPSAGVAGQRERQG